MRSRRKVDRESMTQAIVRALEPLEFVHAAWEAGAVSFGRIDAFSDLDINVDADDARVPEVFTTIETALRRLSPIETKMEIPFPPEHSYAQAFYRLKGTPPFLLIDLAVFRHSSPDKYLEVEIHGVPSFLINRNDALVPPPLDRAAFGKRMGHRLDRLRQRHQMFGCFIEKELRRGNTLEAVFHYQRLLLDPLTEILRMRYHPFHYNFGPRYLHYELPPALVRRLEGLSFVKDTPDLRRKAGRARRWLERLLESTDARELERSIRKGA